MAMKSMAVGVVMAILWMLPGCNLLPKLNSAESGAAGHAPAVREVDDNGIAAAIRDAFKHDVLLATAAIAVQSDHGKVTLSGTVADAFAYNRAISIARQMNGVKPPVRAVDLQYPQ
ncbi:MAG: BON domain-containing protein [Gammaproteobacteria bacterium]